MNKDFSYKKDVILGTWVAVAIFMLTGLATLIQFEVMTAKPVLERDCDVCRWVES